MATNTSVLIAGSVAYSMSGRSAKPAGTFDGVEDKNLYSFHRVAALEGKGIVSVHSGPSAVHFAALNKDGDLYIWGRNERSQLGLGHTRNIYVPAKVTLPGPVASVAIGARHTLVALRNGDVYAAGDNKLGQCGIGKTSDTVPKFTKVPLPEGGAKAVAAGAEFSVALASDGSRVYVCGCPQYGQLGNGSTGEYIVSAGRSAFKERPSFEAVAELAKHSAGVGGYAAVACGNNHTVALTGDGRVFTWGHGGYGRLGHGSATDVLVPTSIKGFEHERNRVAKVAAGGACTFFLCRNQMLYFCGITKKSGEATTHPKPVTDLAGFAVRAIASGSSSTVVAADDTVVAWGPAPTCGELGFGEAVKSSPKPRFVDDAAGCHVIDVTAGQVASLMVLEHNEAAQKAFDSGKFPLYEAADPAGGSGDVAGGSAAAATTGKRKADGAAVGGAAAKKAKK